MQYICDNYCCVPLNLQYCKYIKKEKKILNNVSIRVDLKEKQISLLKEFDDAIINNKHIIERLKISK